MAQWEYFTCTETFELQLCLASVYMTCQSLNVTNDQIGGKSFLVKVIKKSMKDFTVIPIIFQIQFIGDKLTLKHIGGVCALYFNSNIDIN